jgi:hypothetical protein
MILTKNQLFRAYPELCREIAHEGGLIIRDEMMRRFADWRKRVTVISNATGKTLCWQRSIDTGLNVNEHTIPR